MRMFFFYFFRTSWNQIRKFVHTWAFFFFAALFAAGGVIAYWFWWYYRRLSAENAALPTSIGEVFEATGLTGLNLLELAAGILILGILVIQMIGAERSVSSLFRQADVNLLFASDLSPQAVLAFRVANTLNLAIAVTILFAIQIPFLARTFSLSAAGGIMILLTWCMLLAFSALLKILVYELGSRHPFFHRNVRWILFALLGVIGIAFYRVYRQGAEPDFFLSAQRFFNAPWTRWIPVWGWLKGMLLYTLEGHASMAVFMLCLNAALIALLIWAVRRLPADYYEETLSRAQEVTMLNEAASSEDAALLVTIARKREVTWEGFHFGQGSSVYFFRVFHNRRRTSWHFLSKTFFTYCFAALAAGLYVRHFLDTPYEYIHVLLLAVMVFFHTIFSPVTEDIRKDVFLLQPEPVWAKVFFSLLGGSCNCALDVALALMIGSVAAGYSPISGLCYLPVVVSVDFFASASGVFTDVSIPSSIGINFKQVIQILLLYAGLVFDGAVLVYGLNTGHSTAGFVSVFFLNLLFGSVFLGLTGVWLYPCRGRAVRALKNAAVPKGARSAYTRAGIALAGMLLATHASQYYLPALFPEGSSWSALAIYLPIYGIGLPVFCLLMMGGRETSERREMPERREMSENRTLTKGEKGTNAASGRRVWTDADGRTPGSGLRTFLWCIPACLFVMYSGNIIGYLLQGVLRFLIPASWLSFSLFPAGAEPSMGHPVLQALLITFASPLMEEYIFRRCLLDRLRRYGEMTALLSSALAFALFHTTINQLCYGFLLGLVFGYLYLKTGQLRWSVMLHTLINGISAVLLPLLLTTVSRAAGAMDLRKVPLTMALQEPGALVFMILVLLLFVLFLLGTVVFVFGVREHDLHRDGIRMRTACAAPGMAAFLVIAAVFLFSAI